MGDKESRTEKEQWIEEKIIGTDHYKTTISDGEKTAKGVGRTSEEAEKNASDKWAKGETESIGCIISTACIKSKGLDESCQELRFLRQYRDEYLIRHPSASILLNEYYKKAPFVVAAINRTNKSKEIYERIYEELVSKSIRLLRSGCEEDAINNGIVILRALEQEYLK